MNWLLLLNKRHYAIDLKMNKRIFLNYGYTRVFDGVNGLKYKFVLESIHCNTHNNNKHLYRNTKINWVVFHIQIGRFMQHFPDNKNIIIKRRYSKMATFSPKQQRWGRWERYWIKMIPICDICWKAPWNRQQVLGIIQTWTRVYVQESFKMW